MQKENYKGRRLIGHEEMLFKLNVSRPVLYRMVTAGIAPQPVRLGSKLCWDSRTVDEWIAKLAAEAKAKKAA